MASPPPPLILLLCLIATTSLSLAQSHSNPRSLILPITKETTTHQYLTNINIGTPFVQKSLVVDLGGQHLWMDCLKGYKSSTYKPSPCGSSSCSLAKSIGCRQDCDPTHQSSSGCHNNTCFVLSRGPFKGNSSIGEVSRDTIALQSIGGAKTGSIVTIPDFVFSCVNSYNLPLGVQGMLGLGRDKIGFPTQVSSSIGRNFARKFAICLPPNSTSKGVALFGNYPYVFYSIYNSTETIDISYRISRTKLYLGKGDEFSEYFVNVRSIWVDDRQLSINSTLLDFPSAKITTTQPYTILETSIYNSLVKAFDEEISKQHVDKVSPVSPFRDCYNKGLLERSVTGLSVPQITFVFESKRVYWPMFGVNTVVEVSSDVLCLGLLDGGSGDDVSTPVVIGALQLQNSFLEFDLGSSRMGFTDSLLLAEVECSSYKY